MSGRIREEDVALVKERVNIGEVVGDYMTLRNVGGRLTGLCPFHDEKTPSFNVRPSMGVFKCFGCQESGDAIAFLMKLDQLSFHDAVERLATRAGVTLRYEDGSGPTQQERGLRTRLFDAHRAAAEFYAERLVGADAQVARKFLSDRGFDREAAETFGVGYAPRDGDALVRHLRGRGFRDEELVTGGLASEGRGAYDRFRGRLVWPIRDAASAVIGFGARRLHDDDKVAAKYLNTSETPIYKKSSVLYGVDLARKEIARRRQAVIVEGYTDVMACHLAGIPTAIASCGTAFGEAHSRIIRGFLMDQDEFRGEIIFTFDGDEAGQRAALKAFEGDQRFLTQTFVAVEPNGEDPCDLRLSAGDEGLRDLISQRVPLFEFALNSEVARYDINTAEGRTAARRAGMTIVRQIKDVKLREEYARRLAGLTGLADPNELVQEAGGGLVGAQRARRAEPRAADDPVLLVERETVKIAVQAPELVGLTFDLLDRAVFSDEGYARVRDAVAAAGGAQAAHAGEAWVQKVRAAADDERVAALVTELAVEPLQSESALEQRYARSLVARVEEIWLTRRIAELKSRLERTNPVDQATGYNKLFGELIALEPLRRTLRERAIGDV